MNASVKSDRPPITDTWVRLEQSSPVSESFGDGHENSCLDTILLKRNQPVLKAIFTALGVDEHYLDAEKCPSYDPLVQEPAFPEAIKKPWILHVDDDLEFSNALKMRLETYGVFVSQACNGVNGVKQASDQPASAILLDYEMPQGDGKFVLQRLKACPSTRDIPVIILTGHRDRGLKQELLALGSADFLSKPIKLDLVLETLSRYVELHNPRGSGCLLT